MFLNQILRCIAEHIVRIVGQRDQTRLPSCDHRSNFCAHRVNLCTLPLCWLNSPKRRTKPARPPPMHFLKPHYDTEGPFGLPMKDTQAQALEAIVKTLPQPAEPKFVT